MVLVPAQLALGLLRERLDGIATVGIANQLLQHGQSEPIALGVLPLLPLPARRAGIVNLSPCLHSHRLGCKIRLMNAPILTDHYKHHQFAIESIGHADWLYFRFCLGYRDVEELFFERRVTMTDEAIRKWCRKFGPSYANQLRRRRPQPGDT
jgi:hypothetical protein